MSSCLHQEPSKKTHSKAQGSAILHLSAFGSRLFLPLLATLWCTQPVTNQTQSIFHLLSCKSADETGRRTSLLLQPDVACPTGSGSSSFSTSAPARAHHACKLRASAMREPSGKCVHLFHKSSEAECVPAAVPTQQASLLDVQHLDLDLHTFLCITLQLLLRVLAVFPPLFFP